MREHFHKCTMFAKNTGKKNIGTKFIWLRTSKMAQCKRNGRETKTEQTPGRADRRRRKLSECKESSSKPKHYMQNSPRATNI